MACSHFKIVTQSHILWPTPTGKILVVFQVNVCSNKIRRALKRRHRVAETLEDSSASRSHSFRKKPN